MDCKDFHKCRSDWSMRRARSTCDEYLSVSGRVAVCVWTPGKCRQLTVFCETNTSFTYRLYWDHCTESAYHWNWKNISSSGTISIPLVLENSLADLSYQKEWLTLFADYNTLPKRLSSSWFWVSATHFDGLYQIDTQSRSVRSETKKRPGFQFRQLKQNEVQTIERLDHWPLSSQINGLPKLRALYTLNANAFARQYSAGFSRSTLEDGQWPRSTGHDLWTRLTTPSTQFVRNLSLSCCPSHFSDPNSKNHSVLSGRTMTHS